MYDIRITKIGPIVTEPAVDALVSRVSIEVLTTDGQKALELPLTLAMELAATLVMHLRDEQTLQEASEVSEEEP